MISPSDVQYRLGFPIHADGSWNEGSPEALAKYRACKAKNNIS